MTSPKASRACFLIASLALAFGGCLGGGNSGSETTNGLTGLVRDPDGNPVAGAKVLLLPEDHNGASPEGTEAPREARTDRSGTYRFSEVDPGTYNIEIRDSARGLMAFLPGVRVASDVKSTRADGAVDTPGTVEIPLPDHVEGSRPGYLYLPGTTEFERIDSAERASGQVMLGPLAEGTYPSLLLVLDENAAQPVEMAEEVAVVGGKKTVLEPFATWVHSRLIEVDPISGGGAAGTHRDYPLLLRLTGATGGLGATFDFTQGAGDGRDIRFTAVDGGILPHEIETWDSVAGQAALWIRMDSLAFDTKGQAVRMHWGKPGAPQVSSGPEVFDGSGAFASVWHLAEPGNDGPGGYRDASPIGNHATASGINKTPHQDGVAGMAKAFAGDLGSLSARVPKGLGGDAAFTLTFWMKAEMQPGGRSNALHFGARNRLAGFHLLLRADSMAQFGGHDNDPTQGPLGSASWQNVFDLRPYFGKWTHVAVAYDPAARKTVTYMDGVKVSESPMAAEGLAIDPNGGLRIGRALPSANANQELPFAGILDEIRFHAGVLSESRLRLDFVTQKP